MDIYGEKIALPKLDIHPAIKNLPEHYAYCKKTGTNFIKTITLDFNIGLMRIIDAALRSADSGNKQKIYE